MFDFRIESLTAQSFDQRRRKEWGNDDEALIGFEFRDASEDHGTGFFPALEHRADIASFELFYRWHGNRP